MESYFTTDYQKKIFYDRYSQTKLDGTKETIEDTFERISLGNKDVYTMLINKEFIPAGRILSNVGGTGNNMIGNCNTVPLLEDSLDAIMKCQSDTVKVYAKGGGVGTNFSKLRPKDAPVQGAEHGSSGACSFIDAHEGYAETIRQGGSRRAAKMSILNVEHPDILEFIHAKTDHKRWTNTNVSVGISDKFMDAVAYDNDWDLVFEGKVYETISATKLWNEICECAWKSGEPGIVFLDTINNRFPLRYKYEIQETNPCQPADTLVWDVDRLRYITDQNAESWRSWKTGVLDIVELSTNTGLKIKCTPNHEIILKDGTKCEARYCQNKELMQPKDWEELTVGSYGIFVQASEVIRGFLFGDGFICGKRQGISVKLNPDKEPEVATMLEDFGFHRQDSGAYYMNRKDVEAKINIDFLEYPVWSRNLPEDVLVGQPYSFLRGLYAANGSCNKHGQISLKTTNPKLAEHIQIILGSMNIHASICENKAAVVHWQNGDYISKKSYNIQTPNSYAELFQNKIGFFAKAKKNNIKKSIRNSVRIFVTSIQPLGREEVWDYQMNVPPHYNYCQGSVLANCGEQPLVPYGQCLLGSIVLPSFVNTSEKYFDGSQFKKTVRVAVRYMDSLIDIATFPIPEIEEVTKNTRPIGLGVTGLADMLFLMKLPYGNHSKTLEWLEELMLMMYSTAKEESEKLAQEKGAFPDYDYDKADFPARRNSTLLSFAPTGTISGLVGCSYGIEPHFSPLVVRNEDLGRDVVSNPIIDKYMTDNNLTKFPEWARFVGGTEEKYSLTVEDHLEVLKIIANNCDSAVSKTVNLPKDAAVEDVSKIYAYCWKNGIKGITVYRDGCREDQPVSWNVEELEDELDEDDLIEVIDYVANPKHRPDVVEGRTYKVKFSPTEPSMYICINDLEDSPLEIFFKVNNSMHQEYLDGLSRAITSLWRRGIPAEHLFNEFCEYVSPNAGSWYEIRHGKKVYLKSILHAIGLTVQKHFHLLGYDDYKADEKVLDKKVNADYTPMGEECPECHEYCLVPMEGCMTCQSCGYSRCG
jgi:ribonucleoside-diphosphate reductase alpha chain